MSDPLRNLNDPLRKAGPNQQQELFKRFVQVAAGFSLEDVIGACMNLMINAIRQSNPFRDSAEARYNDWVGRFRSILRDHYDGVTGKRRSIFPFDQTIVMNTHNDKDTMN